MGNHASSLPSSPSINDNEKLSIFKREAGVESYFLGEAIARGKDSFCHWGEHLTTGRIVAVKKAWKTGFTAEKCFRRETENMAELKHPGVVTMLDNFEDAKFTYIVMELMPGGTLAERILEEGPMDDGTAAFIFRQLVNAVIYLHDQGVCHRDLKPSNILMVSSDPSSVQHNLIKIGDFGLSRRLRSPYEDQMSTHCGSLNFAAPEVHQAAAHQAGLYQSSSSSPDSPPSSFAKPGCYSAKVDMWSLGAVLYNMLSGAPPFDFTKHNTPTMLCKVLQGEYVTSGPDWEHVSEDARDCVRCLMQVDARQRPTAAQSVWHVWLLNDEAKALLRLGDAVRAQCARAELVMSVAMDLNPLAASAHLLEASVGRKGVFSWWHSRRLCQAT